VVIFLFSLAQYEKLANGSFLSKNMHDWGHFDARLLYTFYSHSYQGKD
jgi:hypothetical protein